MLEGFEIKEPLFAEERMEERFRVEFEKAVDFFGNTDEPIREVDMSVEGREPEAIGRVLAAVAAEETVLLSSNRWGALTREAFSRASRSPAPSGSILIRTGGSSGEPKFAIHTWSSLETAARNLWFRMGREPISSFLDLPLFHVSGWMPVVRALISGGRLGLGDDWRFENFPGARVTSIVPTTLYRSLQCSQTVGLLKQMDWIFAGGAAFSPELLNRAREEELPISLVYGMTETGGMVALQHPEEFMAGDPPTVTAFSQNELTVDEEGEIEIRSDQLFRGYLGRVPRESASWKTGDLGEFASPGCLEIRGRKGRFLSSGGETVSLSKIESVAKNIEGVKDAFVAALPSEEWGSSTLLFVEGDHLQNRDLREELKLVLDPPEVPAQVRVVEEIPRSGLGKVDMDRLLG